MVWGCWNFLTFPKYPKPSLHIGVITILNTFKLKDIVVFLKICWIPAISLNVVYKSIMHLWRILNYLVRKPIFPQNNRCFIILISSGGRFKMKVFKKCILIFHSYFVDILQSHEQTSTVPSRSNSALPQRSSVLPQGSSVLPQMSSVLTFSSWARYY